MKANDMNSMLKLAQRIIAVFRSPRWSFGTLLAKTLNLGVFVAAAYLMLRSPADGGPVSMSHSDTAPPVSVLEPHSWNRMVLAVALFLAFLTAWTHGQRILAVCFNVLAAAILESRRASHDLGKSVDRVIEAIRRFFGFGNEEKPLGRRPPPRKRERTRPARGRPRESRPVSGRRSGPKSPAGDRRRPKTRQQSDVRVPETRIKVIAGLMRRRRHRVSTMGRTS